MKPEIPTEFYVAFLDRSFPIHWNLHAWLMFIAWFVLVPLGVIAIRYFKPAPTPWGLPRGISQRDPRFVWWPLHYVTLYAAIGLSLAGVAIALFVSGGFSGSLHAIFGGATVVFGALQIVAAWNRGSHGGKNHVASDPDDPETWHGDHYDMTRRRRWFEAYHKTGGYLAILLALATVATGLMQFWMLSLAVALVAVVIGGFVLAVWFEGRGFRHDTYRVVYGSHPDHPFNRMRRDL